VTDRPSYWRRPRTRWYGVMTVLLGMLSAAVTASGLAASYAGEEFIAVAERAIDNRSPAKPAAVRHDPAEPKANIWGGSDPAAFGPASLDVSLPCLTRAPNDRERDFGLSLRIALVRDGPTRAPPTV